MHPIGLIARQEFLSTIRNRIVVCGTLVVIVIVSGTILLCAALSSPRTIVIGLSGQSTGIAEQLATTTTAFGRDISVKPNVEPEAGKEDVLAGRLDALVTGPLSAMRVTVKSSADSAVLAALNELAQQEAVKGEFAASGLDPNQVPSTTSTTVQVTTLNQDEPARMQRLIVAWLLGALLLVAAQGASIATVRKFASEALTSVTHPRQVLMGKLIGLGGVGGLCLLAVILICSTTARLAGILPVQLSPLWLTVNVVPWYALGFPLYSIILLAAQRIRSHLLVQLLFILPVAILIMAVSLIVTNRLTSTVHFLSILPFLSAVIMPIRWIVEEVSLWQSALSIVLAIIVLYMLSYRRIGFDASNNN